LGVTTDTPGFTISSQSLMPRGLPSSPGDDGRGVGRAVVRQPLLPVGRQQLRAVGDLVDVAGEREAHHVGIKPVDDGAGLLSEPPCDCLMVTFSPVFASHQAAKALL